MADRFVQQVGRRPDSGPDGRRLQSLPVLARQEGRIVPGHLGRAPVASRLPPAAHGRAHAGDPGRRRHPGHGLGPGHPFRETRFCGSGTLAIEAALMARRTAPGAAARELRLHALPRVRCRSLGTRCANEARSAMLPRPCRAQSWPRTSTPRAVDAARDNARRAGVEADIGFRGLRFQRYARARWAGRGVHEPGIRPAPRRRRGPGRPVCGHRRFPQGALRGQNAPGSSRAAPPWPSAWACGPGPDCPSTTPRIPCTPAGLRPLGGPQVTPAELQHALAPVPGGRSPRLRGTGLLKMWSWRPCAAARPWVQLRHKDAHTRELAGEARALLAVLEPLGVPLVINDDVDAAPGLGSGGRASGPGGTWTRAGRGVSWGRRPSSAGP